MHSTLSRPADSMKAMRNARLFFATLVAPALAWAGFATIASAQEAAPDTAPELNDFRLDAPPKEKAPDPKPEPKEQPKPQAEPAAPQAKPQTTARTSEVQKAKASPTRAERPVDDARQPAVAPAPDASDIMPAVSDPVPASVPAPDLPTNTRPDTPTGAAAANVALVDWWPWLLALASAIAGLAGWLLWRWRRNRDGDTVEPFADTQMDAVEPVAMPAPSPAESQPAPLPPPTSPRTTISRAAPAELHASFEPADARLSLTNLTITGCLRLRYDGPSSLDTLRLRSLVMSACDDQQAQINAFHSGENPGQVDSLDAVQPGEEIVLTLELQVPRDGLQAFDWRERRFIAPILLLNLSSDNSAVAPVRINHLIGRQGDPQSPRMRPLAIDRGPRRFADLQFQPIPV